MSAINQESILEEIIPDVFISKITLETSGETLLDNNPHIDTASEKPSLVQKSDNTLSVKLDLVVKETFADNGVGAWLGNLDIQKYLVIKIFQSTDQKITSALSLSQDMIDLLDDGKNVDTKDIRFKILGSLLDVNTVSKVFELIKNKTSSKTITTIKQTNNNNLGLLRVQENIDDDGNKTHLVSYTVKFIINNENPEHLSYFIVSSFDIKQLAADYNLEYDTLSLDKMNGKVVSEVVIDEGNIVSKSYIFYDNSGKFWTGPVHLNENGKWRSRSKETEDSIDLIRDVVSNNKIQDFRNVKDIQRLQFDFSGVNSKMGVSSVKNGNSQKTSSKTTPEYFSDLGITSNKDGDAKFFFSINFEKLIMEKTIYGGLVKKAGSRFINELIQETKIRQMSVVRRRVKQTSSVSPLGVIKNLEPFDVNEPEETIVLSGEKDHKRFVEKNTKKGSLRELSLILDSEKNMVRSFTGMDKTTSDLTDGYYQYAIDLEIEDNSVDFFLGKIQDLMDAKTVLEAYYNEASKVSMSNFLAEVQNPHIKHPSEKAATSGKTSGNFDIDSNSFTQNFSKTMEEKYSGPNFKNAPWISPILVFADVLDIFTDAFVSSKDKQEVLNSLFIFTSPKTGNPSGINNVIRLMNNLITTLQALAGTTESGNYKKASSSSTRQSTSRNSKNSSKRTFKERKYFNSIFDSNIVKGAALDYLSSGHDNTTNENGLRVITAKNYLERVREETLRLFKTEEPNINIKNGSNEITSNDNISNTSYTFLTPARIDFPQHSISLLGNTNAKTSIEGKIKRIPSHIDDGEVSRKNKIVEIYSKILLQNLSPSPIVLHKEDKEKNEIEDNQSNIEDMFAKMLSANGSVTIHPIEVEVVSDKETGTSIIKPIKTIKMEQSDNLSETPDKHQDSILTLKNKDIERDNAGKITFGLALAKGLSKNGSQNKKLIDQRKPNITISKPIFTESKKIDLVSSLLVKNMTVSVDQKTSTKHISGLNKIITEEKIKELPNQIKAVILSSGTSGVVRAEKITPSSNNTTDNLTSDVENKFQFEMLKKIERLVGFEKNETGEVLIKQPKWISLTKKDFDNLYGKEIVCRMVDYENQDIGLFKNKGIMMDNYDNYFILIPSKFALPPPNDEDGVAVISDSQPDSDGIAILDTNVVEQNIQLVLKENFPNLDFRDAKTGKSSIVNIAKNVVVTGTTKPIDRKDKNVVVVGQRNIQVSTDLAVEATAISCMNSTLDTKNLVGNVINVKTTKELVEGKDMISNILAKQDQASRKFGDTEKDSCSVFDKFRPKKTC